MEVPSGNLASDHNGNIYGTTQGGGKLDLWRMRHYLQLSPNPDGSWSESVLYSFCNNVIDGVCADGSMPKGGVVVDLEGNLYGNTYEGGIAAGCGGGCGVVFELSPPTMPGGTWTETVLHTFCSNQVNNFCIDGAEPFGKLEMDSSGNLFGTASVGGLYGIGGLAYELVRNASWNFQSIYNFCTFPEGLTCLDGQSPEAGLIFDASGNLYGTTKYGGARWGAGAVYKLTPGSSGWAESVLITFRAPYKQGNYPLTGVSIDALGNLYGANSVGGTGSCIGGGCGTVFRLSLNGRSGTFLFNGFNGGYPVTNLLATQEAGVIYGTAEIGGANSGGNVFRIGPTGKQTVLYDFCKQANCADGVGPEGNLLFHNGPVLYGTTAGGGTNGAGVVYQLTPQDSR